MRSYLIRSLRSNPSFSFHHRGLTERDDLILLGIVKTRSSHCVGVLDTAVYSLAKYIKGMPAEARAVMVLVSAWSLLEPRSAALAFAATRRLATLRTAAASTAPLGPTRRERRVLHRRCESLSASASTPPTLLRVETPTAMEFLGSTLAAGTRPGDVICLSGYVFRRDSVMHLPCLVRWCRVISGPSA